MLPAHNLAPVKNYHLVVLSARLSIDHHMFQTMYNVPLSCVHQSSAILQVFNLRLTGIIMSFFFIDF